MWDCRPALMHVLGCLCLGPVSSAATALQVLKLFPEDNVMIVKGAVPGSNGGFIEIVPAKVLGKNVPSHNIKGY